MARVKIGPAEPDRKALDVEVARLRDFDIAALRKHWHTLFKQQAPVHLPRHLLFRVLAYRLQADQLGDVDSESRRLLDSSESPEQAGQIFTRVKPRLAVYSHYPDSANLISATRKTYSGPLEVGRDLMTITIGEEIAVGRVAQPNADTDKQRR